MSPRQSTKSFLLLFFKKEVLSSLTLPRLPEILTVMKNLTLTAVLTIPLVFMWDFSAAAPKVLKFWNLTAVTITELSLATAGGGAWSGNLCLSDPDHVVDPDERLDLVGISAGVYDVRIRDADKRACVFHDVALKAEGPYAFSLSEDQMKHCGGR